MATDSTVFVSGPFADAAGRQMVTVAQAGRVVDIPWDLSKECDYWQIDPLVSAILANFPDALWPDLRAPLIDFLHWHIQENKADSTLGGKSLLFALALGVAFCNGWWNCRDRSLAL